MNPAAAARGSPAPSSSKPGATTNTAKRPRRASALGALSDVTNLLPRLPAADAPTPTKPKRTTRRTTLQQQPPSPDASYTCSSPACVTPAAPKRPFAAGLEAEGSVVKSPAISTVYARRGAATEARGRGRRGAPTTTDKGKGKEPATATEARGRGRRGAPTTTDKDKGKEPATAAADPAAGTEIRPQLHKSTGNSRKTSMAQDTRPISASAPCHREAKKRRPSSSTPKLPDDFVREKRAYFAEIDAFELPEEEVSEADLD